MLITRNSRWVGRIVQHHTSSKRWAATWILEGKQSTSSKILQDGNIINPFAIIDSIGRTPPIDETYSLSELDQRESTGEEKPSKRKRMNHSPEKQQEGENFSEKEYPTKNGSAIKNLEKFINEIYKPKKEFCDISSRRSL